MAEMTFAERRAAARAKFEAEWAARFAPFAPVEQGPLNQYPDLNPHIHYADTSAGTRCMTDRDGVCRIPHNCKCYPLFACGGGCYR